MDTGYNGNDQIMLIIVYILMTKIHKQISYENHRTFLR